jgi:5-formyltetrahydrofolate cyclo-ligase
VNNKFLQKKDLRLYMKSLLNVITPSQMEIAGFALTEHLSSFIDSLEKKYLNAGVIFFANLPNEISTDPLDEYLIDNNIPRILPNIINNKICWQKIPNDLPIKHLKNKGLYNIRTLDLNVSLIDPKEVCLLIIPGLAFDHEGYRLGRGKGFYDKFLHQQRLCNPKSIAVGVGLSGQLVKEIPHDQWDEKMDYLCFDSLGIIKIR